MQEAGTEGKRVAAPKQEHLHARGVFFGLFAWDGFFVRTCNGEPDPVPIVSRTGDSLATDATALWSSRLPGLDAEKVAIPPRRHAALLA